MKSYIETLRSAVDAGFTHITLNDTETREITDLIAESDDSDYGTWIIDGDRIVRLGADGFRTGEAYKLMDIDAVIAALKSLNLYTVLSIIDSDSDDLGHNSIVTAISELVYLPPHAIAAANTHDFSVCVNYSETGQIEAVINYILRHLGSEE